MKNIISSTQKLVSTVRRREMTAHISKISVESMDNMPLKILDATEEDIAEMMCIDQEAYKGSITSRVLFCNGRSTETLKIQGERVIKSAREDASIRDVKIIDTDNKDNSIAFAGWPFHVRDNVRCIQTDSNKRGAIAGADPKVMELWHGTIRRKRIEYIGRTPHCCENVCLARSVWSTDK